MRIKKGSKEVEFGVEKHVCLLHEGRKITLHNLISDFLFHRNISQSKLLNHNIAQEKDNKYIHRGIIFLSLLIQIILDYIAVPMKILGSVIEHFLNGYFVLGGKGGRGSPGFISFIGHLDPRTDLDKEIKPGDGRYYPALSMMAAKLAYENQYVIHNVISNQWKMKFVEFYNFYNEFQEKWTTQAFIFQEENVNNDMIVVAFRGTSPFVAHDWSTDFDLSWCKIKGMGKLHKGFMMALGLKKYYPDDGGDQGDYNGYWPKQIEQDPKYPLAYYTIREKLKEMMANNKKAKFIVTGHSLGGALAVLFPAILALHGEWELLDRLEGIYTYGQPRVGNEKFGEFMKRNLREHHIKYYRIVYGYDVVPTVPWDNSLMMFKHFGTCIHFNSLYEGKVAQEEEKPVKRSNEGGVKRYWLIMRGIVMTLKGMIIARLNAVGELIRALSIGYIAGPEYRESRFLILTRLCAIILPGPMNHGPRDYVNATRLASQHLFLNYDAINM